MTTKGEWVAYTGSDEQIAEMDNSSHGWIVMFEYGTMSVVHQGYPFNHVSMPTVSKYWIIPDDPLREMKIRQAQTGQPVWVRTKDVSNHGWYYHNIPYTEVNWNIPNAEYSFKAFEDTPK